MIQFHNVTIHSLARKEVLTNVSATFSDGKANYIIGKSGEGKSTLLKAILGELPVVSGNIELDGKPLRYDTIHSILTNRRKIGFIFQDFQLVESLTVFENIAYVLHIENISLNQIRYNVEKIACELGIYEKLNYYCHQLSGGEQQRVAIARALIKKPSIILADEPTGNLDPNKSQEIVNIINEIAITRKITIIIVTHDYDLTPNKACNIYQIEDQSLKKVARGEKL
ncbi:cell division ATP-binding protein FtsE [Enterococcus ratti]|uniref:ABC transporter n=1 Tax=Enterococcus ratti TaxID=150033 RepID=A0A1L8WQM6_9ENTE|nr:ATP-binding cassette domain-containing protein [Enterococcus ratti]OJG83132.1 ABC transporter [Enterococcus ratti]